MKICLPDSQIWLCIANMINRWLRRKRFQLPYLDKMSQYLSVMLLRNKAFGFADCRRYSTEAPTAKLVIFDKDGTLITFEDSWIDWAVSMTEK
jgi:hypothetical protein